ncbi:MAG: hypothetical protein EXR72_14165 [Myxococcales bacterium]|nr:hypothetical protein [Myxococcales bacterium]
MTPARTFAAWLAALSDEERAALGRRHAVSAAEGGAVVRTGDGRIVPIPPLLTPEGMSLAERTAMEADAHALVAALVRLTRWLMSDPGAADRARLFHSFAPFEAEALATWREAEFLATARVDYLIDIDGRHRALEVNATIPAMQGYSDIIAESFLRTVGPAHGMDQAAIAALCDENGRNTDDLLASLLEHYRRLGGTAAQPSIAIVHRAGDAQQGELMHYAKRWGELGCPAVLATPDDAHSDGEGHLRIQGRRHDLIYRHVFARRLDPGSAFARACLAPRRHFILNPIASHLEVKGLLGHLSPAGRSDGDADAAKLGLDDRERAAIARALPWTRLLARGATLGPAGEPIADLPKVVAGEGDRFVLKRSWDYGGRSVFLGAHHDAAAAERAGVVMEAGRPLGWAELVAAAVDDPRDAWVAQDLIAFRPERHLVAGQDGVTWRDLYVDRSIYTSLGVAARPSGGACRAAPGKIVNILGGGGLAPLVRDEVLAKLLARR